MYEMEYKYLINVKEYEKLLNKIHEENGQASFRTQVNYYYDDKNYSLDKSKITLRIRQRDSNLSLEIKSEVKNEGCLKVSKEESIPIYKFPLIIDDKFFQGFDGVPGNGDISFKGILITERTTFKPCDGIKLDIDKNIYLGKIDYELEIEFENNLKLKAYELLQYYIGDINNSQCVGKRSRFFSELKRLNSIYKSDITD